MALIYWSISLPQRVGYHDACHLGRGLGLYDEPRALLARAVTMIVEAPSVRREGGCAGGGGLLPRTMVETSVEMARRQEIGEARSIGRYKVRRRIGRGGMGEVWAAWDETLKREVALKLLRTDRQDAVAVARFELEVRATTQLTHPNTVRVFDFGATEDGVSYYAMELQIGSAHV